MILFGLAFGLLEIAFFIVFCLLMIVGCSYDRRGQKEEMKWITFGIATVIAVVYFWRGDILTTETVTKWPIATLTFWLPAIIYIGLGLVYCVPEFFMTVRRATKEYTERWEGFMNATLFNFGHSRTDATYDKKINVRDALKFLRAQDPMDTNSSLYGDLSRAVTNFATPRSDNESIIGVTAPDPLSFNADGNLAMEPKINKGELVKCVSAWAVLWPFYLISLIIGDLLAEVWNSIAEFLMSIGGRFVKFSFKDVFSLS